MKKKKEINQVLLIILMLCGLLISCRDNEPKHYSRHLYINDTSDIKMTIIENVPYYY
jgi:hypothetical protein